MCVCRCFCEESCLFLPTMFAKRGIVCICHLNLFHVRFQMLHLPLVYTSALLSITLRHFCLRSCLSEKFGTKHSIPIAAVHVSFCCPAESCVMLGVGRAGVLGGVWRSPPLAIAEFCTSIAEMLQVCVMFLCGFVNAGTWVCVLSRISLTCEFPAWY